MIQGKETRGKELAEKCIEEALFYGGLIISQLSSPRIEMGGEDIAAKGTF